MIKSVLIFGKRWKVCNPRRQAKEDEEQRFGETSYREGKIRVFKEIHEETGEDELSTLFHECCHAVFDTTCLDEFLTPELEEAICLVLERGLYPLIKAGVFDAHQKTRKAAA
jgi:hypothetical protein